MVGGAAFGQGRGANGEPRVLLIEDDGRTAEAICAILSDGGLVSLDVVGTAAGAMSCIRTAKPNMVLLDLGLPDGDGVDLIRRLRAALFRDPILVVTSATTSERVVAALKSGADGYLFKEDLGARLVPALRELAGGGAPLSSGAAKAVLDELRRQSVGPRNDVALPSLTRRESAVLDLLSIGLSYAEIGHELTIELNTVRTYIRSLYDKLGVQSSAEAVTLGWTLGLLRAPTAGASAGDQRE
jgi:DNA-binding NarL/FixJ family response regulator